MPTDALHLGWGNYLLFIVLAVIIVLSSVTISYIVDTLGKRTRFSGALVAGTLVAFVSSLPEFTSSLTSVLTNHDFSGALGNLIGGNIFRTFMLGAICVMFIFAMKKAKTTKIQVCLIIIQSIVVVLNLLMMIEYDNIGHIFIWFFMMVDILCLLLYAFLIWFMVRYDKSNAQDMEAKKQINWVRQILMRIKIRYVMLIFTIASLLIVGSAVCISFSTDWIKNAWHLDGEKGAFGSSLLLGIVTSIPEIVTVITLLKLGDVDAAITDILGSNMFSLVIMAFVDLVTWQIQSSDPGVNFWDSPESIHLELWFGVELFFLGGLLLVNYLYRHKKVASRYYYMLVGICLGLLILCYIFSLLQESGVIPFFPFPHMNTPVG